MFDSMFDKFLQNVLTPVWPDRDDYITVNEENMLPDKSKNFLKRPYGDADFFTAGSVNPHHTPYDYFSVKVRKKVLCGGSYRSSTNHLEFAVFQG